MAFTSLDFVIFLPLMVIGYYLIPHRHRWKLLLAGSYYFYGSWKAEYLILLLVSTAIDYWAALEMEKRPVGKTRRPFLYASLCGNLGLLFFFKYFNFVSDSIGALFGVFNLFYHAPELKVLLPVGISFYTFQTLAYTIDVYRGEQKAQRHFGIFALYVTFFPQLVAGPIERSGDLLPQFFGKHKFDPKLATYGLQLILWGFFKKLVIADRVAAYVNPVFMDLGAHSAGQLWLVGLMFAYQVYCDFSAYTDIARGSAALIGFNLSENFRRPYFANSTAELWRRWHMTLVTWFRDYVYRPLGGRSRASAARNILIVFALTGLWHGASWTFVIWGMLNGLFMIISIMTKRFREGIWKGIERVVVARPALVPRAAGFALGLSKETFKKVRYVCAVFGTVFLFFMTGTWFRAQSVPDALEAWKIMAMTPLTGFGEFTIPGFGAADLLITFAMIGILETVHVIQERGHSVRAILAARPWWVRWLAYYGLIFLICFLGVFNASAFIYFQF